METFKVLKEIDTGKVVGIIGAYFGHDRHLGDIICANDEGDAEVLVSEAQTSVFGSYEKYSQVTRDKYAKHGYAIEEMNFDFPDTIPDSFKPTLANCATIYPEDMSKYNDTLAALIQEECKKGTSPICLFKSRQLMVLGAFAAYIERNGSDVREEYIVMKIGKGRYYGVCKGKPNLTIFVKEELNR